MIELAELHDRLQQLSQRANVAWGAISSGIVALDAILPRGGLRRGTLVEWLATEAGAGPTICALQAARQTMTDELPLVIVDHDGTFHPPGLGAELDWRRVLLVRCRTQREAQWATDQSLRTSGVGAVLIRFDITEERWLRRWQLAAEQSGTMGLVVRHLSRQPEACFSDVRILVTPLDAIEGRRVRLELLRSRQGAAGAATEASLDDHAHSLPSPVPSEHRRAARA